MIKVPGLARFDVTAVLENPLNVLLMGTGGGMLFIHQEPGIYEVHTNWLKAARGKNALRSGLEAAMWMFLRTDCMIIQTRVPAFNRAAERMTAIVGGMKDFERKAAWPAEPKAVDVSFWSMSYESWLRKRPADVIAAGQQFYERLDAEYARHRALRAIPQEDCRDLYAGAAVEMIRWGQPEKGVILYNRWARFAGLVRQDGFGLMTLIAKNPLMVDIEGALIQFLGDGMFKVVKPPLAGA